MGYGRGAKLLVRLVLSAAGMALLNDVAWCGVVTCSMMSL